jgi:hypothetical protein
LWHSHSQLLFCFSFPGATHGTAGLGQSEIAVCDTTDMLMLLVPPAAGDELQVRH